MMQSGSDVEPRFYLAATTKGGAQAYGAIFAEVARDPASGRLKFSKEPIARVYHPFTALSPQPSKYDEKMIKSMYKIAHDGPIRLLDPVARENIFGIHSPLHGPLISYKIMWIHRVLEAFS